VFLREQNLQPSEKKKAEEDKHEDDLRSRERSPNHATAGRAGEIGRRLPECLGGDRRAPAGEEKAANTYTHIYTTD
jgi:hypothetical protein